ncbi:hypothetical protein [Roseibacillus ishigakijimensis]|uniref:Uncharacterized protein n=1 Tax=Roseibacillus ishigakijimensis TaxID=454146 RepID=A0A934VLT6_9BACT|nr:hypothetical protein [Roseibacillus ishigakijimensis]MBK1835024.1 hypothetical protein [Roseibacillus ishigakijimensis]
MAEQSPTYRITKYRRSRNWAVYQGEELLVVTVYKKGAQAVVDALTAAHERKRPARKSRKAQRPQPALAGQ